MGLGWHLGRAPLLAWRLAASASASPAVALSFFLCCAVAVSAVSGIQLEPPLPPSNIRGNLSVENCHWHLSWAPVEKRSDCDLKYMSFISVGGAQEDFSVMWCKNTSRSLPVPLGQEVAFHVETECMNSGRSRRKFANIPLSLPGKPGTGARNIRCTWYYTKKIVCSWQRGENASLNTFYNLTYWHNSSIKSCSNYTKGGNVFRCTFDFKELSLNGMGVSIQSSSRDIQPVCLISGIGEKNFLRKLSPPSIIHVERKTPDIFLNWSAPANVNGICYQVEVNSSAKVYNISIDQTSTNILALPKGHHSFRVRSIIAPIDCTSEDSEWSEWSEKTELDERDTTFSLLLYIFILLFVTFLTIIVLVYLKSIKLMFLPTIPDPEKFLKHMFEDQSEDFQKYPTLEEPGKEEQQTHLLEFL